MLQLYINIPATTAETAQLWHGRLCLAAWQSTYISTRSSPPTASRHRIAITSGGRLHTATVDSWKTESVTDWSLAVNRLLEVPLPASQAVTDSRLQRLLPGNRLSVVILTLESLEWSLEACLSPCSVYSNKYIHMFTASSQSFLLLMNGFNKQRQTSYYLRSITRQRQEHAKTNNSYTRLLHFHEASSSATWILLDSNSNIRYTVGAKSKHSTHS